MDTFSLTSLRMYIPDIRFNHYRGKKSRVNGHLLLSTLINSKIRSLINYELALVIAMILSWE